MWATASTQTSFDSGTSDPRLHPHYKAAFGLPLSFRQQASRTSVESTETVVVILLLSYQSRSPID